MRKLLNTLICILLTSSLNGIELNLKDAEFGQWSFITVGPSNAITPSTDDYVILYEGDVFYPLSSISDSITNNGVYSGPDPTSFLNITDKNGYLYNTSTSTIIAGPCIIRPAKRHRYSESTSIMTARGWISYAILRAGASTQSSYVTIPANSSGNFEVKLQTSSDLQNWSPTTPGIFPYGDNAKFFRLVVE